jgi:simple sugar transport system substrate-binding protein
MGEKIVAKVPSGEVGLFIATPGSANLQPRIEGAEKVLKAHGISIHTVATGAAVPGEESAIEAFYKSHTGVKGMYSVDGGSTESLAKVMQKLGLKGKVHAGGFDLTEQTQNLLKAGFIEFTIDQQPYLQGFVPALQLFFYKVSGTQTGPFEANTGLKFVTKDTVDPYVTKSRYEGTTSAAAVVK